VDKSFNGLQSQIEVEGFAIEVKRGGVLAMRPLVLHSSSAAQTPRHRRVIHIEYSATVLPEGLEWM
jgi:hypothetical protein